MPLVTRPCCVLSSTNTIFILYLIPFTILSNTLSTSSSSYFRGLSLRDMVRLSIFLLCLLQSSHHQYFSPHIPFLLWNPLWSSFLPLLVYLSSYFTYYSPLTIDTFLHTLFPPWDPLRNFFHSVCNVVQLSICFLSRSHTLFISYDT